MGSVYMCAHSFQKIFLITRNISVNFLQQMCSLCVQQDMDVLMDNIKKSHVFVTSEKASVDL